MDIKYVYECDACEYVPCKLILVGDETPPELCPYDRNNTTTWELIKQIHSYKTELPDNYLAENYRYGKQKEPQKQEAPLLQRSLNVDINWDAPIPTTTNGFYR